MPEEKVEFTGDNGHELAGTIVTPDGAVRASAIFAHCFTCTQKSLAATRVTRALAERGVATLRFDFSGLGESEGDFAAAGFAANVDDLAAAAKFLTQRHGAPALLVGHSLGGAASLVAAQRMPSLKAVATIGAPSNAVNILKSIQGDLDAIRQNGEGQVTIAGRQFPMSASFLEQASEANVLAAAAALDRPLMICHAPLDATVSIDHAAALYAAAKHPKSFLSLDKADHLLTQASDAVWLADMLVAWAGRYLA